MVNKTTRGNCLSIVDLRAKKMLTKIKVKNNTVMKFEIAVSYA